MYRILKIMRMVVSSLVFIVLGVGLTCPAWMLPGVGPWLQKIQIGPAVAVMSLGVFACWMLITLVFGRVFCSTVCPMGTLQDISARSFRLSHKRREKWRYVYSPAAPALRYGFLALILVSLAIGFSTLPSVLEPDSAFERICRGFFNPMLKFSVNRLGEMGFDVTTAPYYVTVSVASSIIASFLFAFVAAVAALSGRTICNTLCPVGTVLGFVSRYSIFQFDIDTDKCTQCRKCVDVCKCHCINITDHVVDGSRCVVCFDCTDVCPDDAIHYTTDRKRLSQPLMQRLGRPPKQAEAETTMANPDSAAPCHGNDSDNSNSDETIS